MHSDKLELFRWQQASLLKKDVILKTCWVSSTEIPVETQEILALTTCWVRNIEIRQFWRVIWFLKCCCEKNIDVNNKSTNLLSSFLSHHSFNFIYWISIGEFPLVGTPFIWFDVTNTAIHRNCYRHCKLMFMVATPLLRFKNSFVILLLQLNVHSICQLLCHHLSCDCGF